MTGNLPLLPGQHEQHEGADRGRTPNGSQQIVDLRANAIGRNIHTLVPQAKEGPGVREFLAEQNSAVTKAPSTIVLQQKPAAFMETPVLNISTDISSAQREESGLEGSSKAAMGVGAGTINAAVGVKTGLTLAAGGSLTTAALTVGASALAGASVGGYIGSKFGHPILGANIGAASGLTAMSAAALVPAMPGILAASGISVPAWLATGVGAGALGVGASALGAILTVAVPCAAGAGLYGLGRLTSSALGVKKGGVMKNLLLGAGTVGTAGLLPLVGYLLRKK